MLNVLSEKLGKWFCPLLRWQRPERDNGLEMETSLPDIVFIMHVEQPGESINQAIVDRKLMVGGKEGGIGTGGIKFGVIRELVYEIRRFSGSH